MFKGRSRAIIVCFHFGIPAGNIYIVLAREYIMLGNGGCNDIELDQGKHKDLYKTVRYCAEGN